MDGNPKRRKYKDNPYTIKKEGNTYFVSFKDVLGTIQELEITKEVYQIFDEFELKDLSQMNEFDNHIEHSEIYENNLEKRAKEKTISIEDDFIQKATFEELKKAIEMLPKVQKRRVRKYYFQYMGEIEIANQEGVSQKNVSETLKAARKNLKKFLEKFN